MKTRTKVYQGWVQMIIKAIFKRGGGELGLLFIKQSPSTP